MVWEVGKLEGEDREYDGGVEVGEGMGREEVECGGYGDVWEV